MTETASTTALTPQAAGPNSAPPTHNLPPPTAPPPVPAEPDVKLTALMPADGVNTGDSTSLRWPKELPITANTDYVSFQFYNYNPPFGKGELDDLGAGVQGSPLATAGAATTPPAPAAPAADAATGDSNETPLGSASALYKGYTKTSVYGPKNKAKGYQNIILFMPEDLGSEMKGQWGAAGWGLAAQSLLKTVGTKDNLAEAVTTSLAGLNSALKIGVYEGVTKAVNGITGGEADINQVMGGITGTIINPNVEMMYQAPDLRTFTLNFKMVPRNAKEAVEIRKICTTFRRAMLPSFGGAAWLNQAKNVGGLLTIPKIVQPTFMSGSSPNEYIPQYKPCVISGVTINYTPDGAWAAYKGGSPVATNLSIDFKETKLIFEQEVNMEGVTF